MNKIEGELMHEYNAQIMIGMEEILSLIDEEFGYAQDPDIRILMEEQDIPESYKHLINRRYMLRYFDYYSENHGYNHYSEWIRMGGRGTKGTKYNYADVLRVINDPDIRKRIEEQLKKKSRSGIGGIRVPQCLFSDYVEMIADEKDPVTGYTQNQLQLLSVDDCLLKQRKEYVEKKIAELKAKLSRLQNELNDLDEELKDRQKFKSRVTNN